MKTPKQLNNYYIHLLLNSLSKEEHKKEVIRLNKIIGARHKRKRTELEQEFIDFIEQSIYKNSSAFDLTIKRIIEAKNNRI